jgi:hypothetical protein
MGKFAVCRSCGADIVWAIHEESGRRAPFDAEPTEDGTFFVLPPDDAEYPLRAVYHLADHPDATRARIEGKPRVRSHFASCPRANEHRKPRTP